MKDTRIPATRAGLMRGIIAEGIQHAQRDPQRQRLAIMFEKMHMAAAVASYVLYKFTERFCLRQIDNRAGFAAVAIAARDHNLVPSLRQLERALVFFPP